MAEAIWVYGKALVDQIDGTSSSFYIPAPLEPGAICPTCGEKTPTKHALAVRAWRKKRKDA